MANVSSSNGLEKRPKLRFPGFDEPWNTALLSDYFVKSTKKNSDGMISNVICNSAKQGEYYGAAEPPVRCGESHLSGLTEPPVYSYSA